VGSDPDASTGGGRDAHAVLRAAASIRVILELEPTEPVGGRLTPEGSAPVAFSGWIGLHAVLEQLLAEIRQP
jgi:hypothetical protein